MSASDAIGRISESIKHLLVAKMQYDAQVTVLTPAQAASGSTKRINLFLYKIDENPQLKNLDRMERPGDPAKLVPPPLSLNLYYLMTPYTASGDQETGNVTAHGILGDAMRVFYENAIVPEEFLAGDLKDARERIQIVQRPVDMDELSKIWSTFNQGFQLSIPYEISVVQIDQGSDKEKERPPSVTQLQVAEVEPFQPPVVDRLEPRQGPAGVTVTFHGRHLATWKASVWIAGNALVEGMELVSDSFEIALPGDLGPGFYEIRVNISQRFVQTFFFRVIAP